MLTFNKKFFFLTLLLFITEVLIALYVRDRFVRPYGGDYLVVMLIYCFVRTFLNSPVLPTAVAVLLFAYLIETLQYFRLVDRLGLEHNVIAKTVIGYGFSWIDMLAYTLGIATILAVAVLKKQTKK